MLIFLKNSKKIIKSRDIHRNEFISYDGMGWCMTYIFKSNKQDYIEILGDIYKECDDKSVRDIEICTWLRLQDAKLDIGSFSVYPDIDGKMGDTENLYTRNQIERVLRTILIKLGIFTINSRTGKVFWNLYKLVTGRKAYATQNDI